MQDVSSLGKKRSLEPLWLRLVRLWYYWKQDANLTGRDQRRVWAQLRALARLMQDVGKTMALPCTTLLSTLSPPWVQTLPLLCGEACSPWFSLVWIPDSGPQRQFNGLGSTSMEQDSCCTNTLLQSPLGISGNWCISQLCECLRCWMISPSNLCMVNGHTIEV